MSLLKLPEIHADASLSCGATDARPDALQRWNPSAAAVQAAAADGSASISIYDAIGDTYDGQGWTAARVSAILRNVAAGSDVVVNLNSPGGDFFEGVAIYNVLRQYAGKVTVNVMGLAASAASVVAMAGDEILMGEGAFLMIHNAWAVAAGNRNDFLKAAATLAPFDEAMASLYAARSGMKPEEAAALMDAETWIGARAAVDKGLASGMLPASTPAPASSAQRKAKAMVEASLARAGHGPQARAQMLACLAEVEPSEVRIVMDQNAHALAPDTAIAASLANLLKTIQG
ncbi:head maturation protease, ClpP-related [Paraburkholderia sp. J8-2]|uniref:head maturation protease, ClpP-related n=1 Tax=Paraburkholderia sp. J8-2 TaxID=2805440 RepID=UPI002AB6ED5D|nr:head maturation protease, ClpP-related [Paraburkholderia sp. J8-2]